MGWPEPWRPLTSVPPLQDVTSNQGAEVVVQEPYPEVSRDAAFPLPEEAEDGGLGEQWAQAADDTVGPPQGLHPGLSPVETMSVTCFFTVFNVLQTLAKRHPFEVFLPTPRNGHPEVETTPVSETLHLRLTREGSKQGAGPAGGRRMPSSPPSAPHPAHRLSICPSVCPCLSPLDFPEPHATSNDSDSELEEASDLSSPAGGAALHRLGFLEKLGGEAGAEGGRDSRSGSEEQLGTATGEGEDGPGPGVWEDLGEEPAQRLAEHNTNQCNNVAVARLPAVRLRGGRLAGGAGWERRPEFV